MRKNAQKFTKNTQKKAKNVYFLAKIRTFLPFFTLCFWGSVSGLVNTGRIELYDVVGIIYP